jgi:hypothetical protein
MRTMTETLVLLYMLDVPEKYEFYELNGQTRRFRRA